MANRIFVVNDELLKGSVTEYFDSVDWDYSTKSDVEIKQYIYGNDGDKLHYVHLNNFSSIEIETSKEKDAVNADGQKFVRRIIKGYASTTDLDREQERFAIECLRDAKAHLLQPGSSTVFLNHEWHEWPIGCVIATDVDSRGLIVYIELADDEKGIRVWNLIQQGILKCFSIGFRVLSHEVIKDEQGRVTEVVFTKVQLYEVSVVGIPCNTGATIDETFVKSFFEVGPKEQLVRHITQTGKDVSSEPFSLRDGEVTMEAKEIKELVVKILNDTFNSDEVVSKLADAIEQKRTERETLVNNNKNMIETAVKQILKDSGIIEEEKPVEPTIITMDALKAMLETHTATIEEKIKEIRVIAPRNGGTIVDNLKSKALDKPNKTVDVDKDETVVGGEETLLTAEKIMELPVTDLVRAVWHMDTDEGKAAYAKLSSAEKDAVAGVYMKESIKAGRHEKERD